MKIELEKGKAIIKLAHLTIIFAGFMFVLGGVAYTNSINTLSTSLPMINSQVIELTKSNLSKFSYEKQDLLTKSLEVNVNYLNTVKPQLDIVKISFYIGCIHVLISIIIWSVGYWKIKKCASKFSLPKINS